MPDWIKAWWSGLSMPMRWFVMIVIVAFVFFVMSTFVFMGTDWSGPAGWFAQ